MHAHKLVEPQSYPTTVLTKEWGAMPSYNISFYCRKCLTRYQHNYGIHSNTTLHTYYPGAPRFIQASQKFFIKSSLCDIFTTMMNCAWYVYTVLVHVCASAAFIGLPHPTVLGYTTRHSHHLHTTGRLAAEAHQANQLFPALKARNEHMMGIRQEQWNHACDKCTHVFDGDGGAKCVIRLVVTDGITLGHPCCAGNLECKTPLPNNRSIYCPEHLHKAKHATVTTGFKTCADPDHCACEDHYKLMGKAMFQLKSRLEHNKMGQTNASIPEAEGTGVNDYDEQAVENGMDVDLHEDTVFHESEGAGLEDEGLLVSGTGKVKAVQPDPEPGLSPGDLEPIPTPTSTANHHTVTKDTLCLICAHFGHKRTHNEELCVASCGMILGRVTFYGSEGPNGRFWKDLFPTGASLPNVMWMDPNCALPINVFHYKCKHRKTNTWCMQNCNPALWPELMVNSSWLFNFSAAEQTNAWLGGFLSIVHEMCMERYNFFLDEMIRRQNNMIYFDLKEKGHSPYLIPHEELL
ncbi:hypothetical protein K439DRAFT_1649787 [Ramaria rubella]|nr:hypothetical protein K439DRAFT_1649787 [Ramaria rubella]